MLIQASIEALRTRFDASGLVGTEAVYASRDDDDIAFVAIAANGEITTYKSDGYSDALLEEEIMTLCCAKYDDKLTHLPHEISDDNYDVIDTGSVPSILIELLAAFIVLILGVFCLLIYWLLFSDIEKILIIGAIICLPVILFIFPWAKARG